MSAGGEMDRRKFSLGAQVPVVRWWALYPRRKRRAGSLRHWKKVSTCRHRRW
jgi:hypothetical protein